MAIDISEIIKVLEKIVKNANRASKKGMVPILPPKEEVKKLLEYSKRIWYHYIGK